MAMKGRVLVIAGSDPSGGAGIQADIKTVTALGGYASAAITALTVQNTLGVKAVHQVSPDFIRDQIIAVLEDIGADAIKIGMIGDPGAAHVIAETLQVHAVDIPIVLDPVLVATSGDALAGSGMAQVLMETLIPMSAVVTPNAEEATALTELRIENPDDLACAGIILREAGANAALVKGGHLEGDIVTDVLVAEPVSTKFENPRLESTSTHGTGCTLASAVATGLAQGMELKPAVARAIRYVHKAIETAPDLGGGAGPLNHGHTVRDF